MNTLAKLDNPIVTMTSLELVEFVNQSRKFRADAVGAPFPSRGFAKLEHSDFLKKVLEVLGESVAGNFSGYYTALNGKQNPSYTFPKREACLMAMSYSYELQAKVFDKMTELEAKLSKPAFQLPDFTNPAAAARAWADVVEQKQALALESAQKQALLAEAAPKVEFVDRYVESTGLKGFRQVAKLLNINEPEFREFLTENEIMYRLGGEWVARQNHIDAGRFQVKTGTSEVSGHAYNASKFTPKGVTWIAGLIASKKALSALGQTAANDPNSEVSRVK